MLIVIFFTRLGLLLTLLLMTINLNNSATDKIPPSGKICPLVQWILISIAFILFALFEYFLILVVLRFWDKVNGDTFIEVTLSFAFQMGDKAKAGKVSDSSEQHKVMTLFSILYGFLEFFSRGPTNKFCVCRNTHDKLSFPD